MTDIGVLVPFQHAVCKRRHLVLREVDCGVDLFKNKVAHEFADYGVGDRLADGVNAAEVCNGHHCGMRAVENFDLALLVGVNVVRKDNVQPRAVRGEHLLNERLLF